MEALNLLPISSQAKALVGPCLTTGVVEQADPDRCYVAFKGGKGQWIQRVDDPHFLIVDED
jgi:hypothetical protein